MIALRIGAVLCALFIFYWMVFGKAPRKVKMVAFAVTGLIGVAFIILLIALGG